MVLMSSLAGLFCCIAGAGIAQVAVSAWAVERFAKARTRAPSDRPRVTILKPLHGGEPMLEEALESFFVQDYPDYQLVFGVESPADPAIAVVERLRARYPSRDTALVIDDAQHGLNRKISNVINMMRVARYDLLVLADSDLHAAPDYLDHLAAALEAPKAGVATTLYSGLPAHPGLPGRLGASYISHVFLPGALMARVLGRQDCLGATMALTRDTLERVGGFEALVGHLADDAALGRLVLQQGLSVQIASTVPATTVPESTLPALVEHEMRWSRTIRAIAPVGLAMSLIQFPIAWALLGLAVSGFAVWALAVLGVAWGARAAAALHVNHRLRLSSAAPVLSLPLRDLICVAEILASYHGARVRWRGHVVPLGPLPSFYDAAPPAAYRATQTVLGEG